MLFIDNKYTRWYYNIIQRAQTKNNIGYTERHHIIPKSLGGNDTADNLVRLSAREHFICHQLLVRMTQSEDKSKMAQAAWMMAAMHGNRQQRYKVTNRMYERLRTEMSLNKKSKTTWNKGVEPTDQTRRKLRAASNNHLVKLGKITQEEADWRNSLPLGTKNPKTKERETRYLR